MREMIILIVFQIIINNVRDGMFNCRHEGWDEVITNVRDKFIPFDV
jgi:hypothetical protein